MVRVRADVERKRLSRSHAAHRDLYTAEHSACVYGRLLAICRLGSAAGFPMIADATFLAREQRLRFASLAARQGGDPSDADLQVLVCGSGARKNHWAAMNGAMWCELARPEQPARRSRAP